MTQAVGILIYVKKCYSKGTAPQDMGSFANEL